jgi:hypothetical protein
LATAPEGATLPRLETPHHSRAVGTYGPRVVAHAATYGLHLRWWQAYVMHRLLEHDKDGVLLWAEAAVSVARQVGKGYGGIRPLAEWRMDSADLFGEPQTVLHLAHQVNVVMEIATPAIARHRDLGSKVRLTNGEQSIVIEDGSRWLMRSTTGAYGFSVSMPLVDEVWAVPPRTIDSMVIPTMAERSHPQLVMWSTANAHCTPTYPKFVSASGEEEDRLVIEWSSPPEARDDLSNIDYWKMASPHWSDQRERMMRRQLEKASRADFMANWLNMWPDLTVTANEKAMPGWAALKHAPPAPSRGGIFAIDESRIDASVFGCLRLVGDYVYYSEHSTLEDAVRLANNGDHVIVGLSLAEAAAAAGLRVPPVKYGLAHTAALTPLLCSTIKAGRLYHDHNPTMAEQAAGAVVVETERGRTLSVMKSSPAGILAPKLLAWALGYQRTVSTRRAAIY